MQRQFVMVRANEHTREDAGHASHAWNIEESLDLYQVEAWGKGYFSINAAGHVVVRPEHGAGPRDRPVRGGAGAQGARPAHPGGHPLLGHPRAPPAPPRRGVRHGHRRRTTTEPLRRGLPDQGQPAAPGGRGGVPLRQGIRLRPGGRLQARAAGGHGDDRGCSGPHGHLQRLQGRQLHRGGHPRGQARPHHHPGGGELRGDSCDLCGTPSATGCARRSACASSSRARAPAAGASRRRREIQVRPVHQRDPRPARAPEGARHARLPAARALPPGQPAAGHPPRQGRDQRARARVCRAEDHGRGPEVHRHRRRPGRRLRRQRHQLRLVDELHAERVRERRGVPHRERVQRARHPASDDHQRVGARHRRASQRADLQRAGLLGAGPVQGHRAARRTTTTGERGDAAAGARPVRQPTDR